MGKACGNCKWHTYENVTEGWVCYNDDSEYFGDWMDHDHGCEDHEERTEE